MPLPRLNLPTTLPSHRLAHTISSYLYPSHLGIIFPTCSTAKCNCQAAVQSARSHFLPRSCAEQQQCVAECWESRGGAELLAAGVAQVTHNSSRIPCPLPLLCLPAAPALPFPIALLCLLPTASLPHRNCILPPAPHFYRLPLLFSLLLVLSALQVLTTPHLWRPLAVLTFLCSLCLLWEIATPPIPNS